jgi:hypothetical protein
MELLGDARHVVTLRLLRVVLFLALGCFVCLSAAPTRADELPSPPLIFPPSYQVTGAFLIVGNPVCGGLPCTETISFSFDFGYLILYPDSGFTDYTAYVSDVLANWSGPLGSFTESSAGQGPDVFPESGGPGPFLGFSNGTDEIDLHITSIPEVLTPVAPSLGGADLYACGTTTCLIDFGPPNYQSETPPVQGIFASGPAEVTVTPIPAIPEPATLSLLACGLLVLGLMEFAHRKIRVQKRLITPLA